MSNRTKPRPNGTQPPAVRSGAAVTRGGGGPLESTTVSIEKVVEPGTDGATNINVRFDLSEAPVPHRRFVADTAWAEYRHGTVRVLFGQRHLSSGGLRALVIVSLSPDGYHQFLESTRLLTTNLAQLAARMNLDPFELQQVPTEPTSTVTLACNIIAAAFAGHEACLDCFSMSPWAYRSIPQVDRLAVEPVVRIELPSFLLLSIMQLLYKMQPQVPPRALAP